MNSFGDSAPFNKDELIIHQVYDALGNPDRDFTPGSYVMHFKGDIYRIIGVSTHTETDQALMIYESLTNGPRRLWSRPYEMFIDEVDLEDIRNNPSIKQKYRFEKVWLEKRPATNQWTHFTYTEDTEYELLTRIRDFFNSCDEGKHERVQVWQAIERPININETRPSTNQLFTDASAKVYATYYNSPKTIVLETPNIRTTIHYGDEIHFCGTRMVLEDRKQNEHDFFEIIPDVI